MNIMEQFKKDLFRIEQISECKAEMVITSFELREKIADWAREQRIYMKSIERNGVVGVEVMGVPCYPAKVLSGDEYFICQREGVKELYKVHSLF